MGSLNILPPDIILEILTRLPTESVLACKLVCKLWRNLVYHPCFSEMHLPGLTDPGKLTFLCIQYHQLIYLEYNEDHQEQSIRRINIGSSFEGSTIAGSCNGLICLNASDDSDYQPAYICNPITKEYCMLPKCNRYENPRTYHLYDGFGYLRETNEYKVVRIYKLKRKPNLDCVEVYTLGSGNGWREVGDFGLSSCDCSFDISHGVFVSNSLYWITTRGKIICFDLAEEKLCEIPVLPCLSSGMFFSLGVLGGHLWCSNISFDDPYTKRRTTWLLKKIGSHNMMLMKECLSSTLGRELVDMEPLALMKSGEVLCCNSNNLYSYDIKSSSYIRVANFPRHVYRTIPHMNTFISLKALGEEGTKIME